MDHELREGIIINRAYLLMCGGREHNVYITSVGEGYIFGFVAINKTLLLIDKKNASNAVVKVVSPREEQSALDSGDELIHSIPVVTVSDCLKIMVKIDSVDIIEDPWRTFLDPSVVSSSGVIINEKELLRILPKLSGYFVEGKGFVSNPDVWVGLCEPRDRDRDEGCPKIRFV